MFSHCDTHSPCLRVFEFHGYNLNLFYLPSWLLFCLLPSSLSFEFSFQKMTLHYLYFVFSFYSGVDVVSDALRDFFVSSEGKSNYLFS